MASFPPKKNTAFNFQVALTSRASRPQFQANPTLAAGDVLVYIDGASSANIASLPTAIDSGSVLTVALTAAEMNGDAIAIEFSDAAGAEWDDLLVTMQTSTRTIDDLATQQQVSDAIAEGTFVPGSTDIDFSYFRGDEIDIRFDAYAQDGTTPLDLSAATGVTWALFNTSDVQQFSKALGGDITVVVGDDGSTQNRVQITMATADTSALTASVKYRHELQILDASGKRSTDAQGVLTLLKDLITT